MLVVVSTEVNYFSRLVVGSREYWVGPSNIADRPSHPSTVRDGRCVIALLARKSRAPRSARVCYTWWFLHDWTRSHTARSVSNWLDDNNFNHFKPCLGNYSDLNPVENV